MTILLTLYLAGMPFALAWLFWALAGIPRGEVGGLAGLAAITLWMLLWPLFAALCIYTYLSER